MPPLPTPPRKTRKGGGGKQNNKGGGGPRDRVGRREPRMSQWERSGPFPRVQEVVTPGGEARSPPKREKGNEKGDPKGSHTPETCVFRGSLSNLLSHERRSLRFRTTGGMERKEKERRTIFKPANVPKTPPQKKGKTERVGAKHAPSRQPPKEESRGIKGKKRTKEGGNHV